MFQNGFDLIEQAVDAGEHVTDAQGRYYGLAHTVLLDLARHADGKTGENAWPSVERMAKRWHKSPREVRTALDRLEELGLIEDMSHEDRPKYIQGGIVTVWRVLLPDDAVEELMHQTARQEAARKAKSARTSREARARQKGVTGQMQSRDPANAVTRDRADAVTLPVIEVQEAPDAPVRDQMHGRPNFPRGIPKAASAPAPEPTVPDLAEQLMGFVLPKMTLTKEESRRAHTTLMKFAARWPNALKIAELGFTLANGQPEGIELGHFDEENDHLYAVPLNARVEAPAPV